MKRRLLWIFGALALVGSIGVFYLYQRFIVGGSVPANLPEEQLIVYVPTGADFDQVVDTLVAQGIVSDVPLFRELSDRMEYKRDPMRSGRFEVKPGMRMHELIRYLRNGKQAPIDLVLTNERLLENVAAKAARFIEPDSLAILTFLREDPLIGELGYNQETLMSLFIPNTYEFFWNTTPQGFVERMHKEHERFWDANNRRQKAENLDLTPAEVYTLASIVEKETLRNDEKRRMAGVYYNRLQKGMRLQADPTSVFARRDFDTKRVTDYHTKFDSPYNTYLYSGLPPGPIAMSSISSIDAVLNVENHDYVYFCAKGDGSGYHNFARTLAQHNRNAQIYRENLRKRGLR
jgi:UPF0755 protein